MEINADLLKERLRQDVPPDIYEKKIDEMDNMSVMQMTKFGIDIHEDILKLDLPKKDVKNMKKALKSLKKFKMTLNGNRKPTNEELASVVMMVSVGLWLAEGE